MHPVPGYVAMNATWVGGTVSSGPGSGNQLNRAFSLLCDGSNRTL